MAVKISKVTGVQIEFKGKHAIVRALTKEGFAEFESRYDDRTTAMKVFAMINDEMMKFRGRDKK